MSDEQPDALAFVLNKAHAAYAGLDAWRDRCKAAEDEAQVYREMLLSAALSAAWVDAQVRGEPPPEGAVLRQAMREFWQYMIAHATEQGRLNGVHVTAVARAQAQLEERLRPKEGQP